MGPCRNRAVHAASVSLSLSLWPDLPARTLTRQLLSLLKRYLVPAPASASDVVESNYAHVEAIADTPTDATTGDAGDIPDDADDGDTDDGDDGGGSDDLNDIDSDSGGDDGLGAHGLEHYESGSRPAAAASVSQPRTWRRGRCPPVP